MTVTYRTTMALILVLYATALFAEDSVNWPAGDWRGTLSVGEQPLEIVYHIEFNGDQANGKMDVPAQGAMGLALQSVLVENDRLSIEMPLPGEALFEGARDGEVIKGTFSQAGQSLPMTLKRAAATAPPRRPQEPTQPLPYRSEAVSFKGTGNIRLDGTLTRPEGSGPFPGVVLVAGAGAQDRDGTFMNHRPLLVLADHLTRAGFAVLRFDERGVGKSEGEFARATAEKLAGDIAGGTAFLRGRDSVHAGRVGIVAHSEGGRISALAVEAHDAADFLILLGAPARPGIEGLRAQGAQSANPIERLQAAMAEAMLNAGDRSEFEAAMREAANGALTDAQRNALDGREEAIVDQLVHALGQPQARFSLEFDPRPALVQADIPVLALYGGKDRQIDATGASQAWRAALESGATIETLPGLNHFFQEAETGAPSEYAAIEQTIAPQVMNKIVEWLSAQAGGR